MILPEQRLVNAAYVYMIDLGELISIAQSGCDAVNNGEHGWIMWR
jgi:hypothetical protein